MQSYAVSLICTRPYSLPQGMGIARVRCGQPCSCVEQQIDAHSVSTVRNVSVFVEHTFMAIIHASQSCLLAVRVTDKTSSGNNKFKLRSVTARDAA